MQHLSYKSAPSLLLLLVILAIAACNRPSVSTGLKIDTSVESPARQTFSEGLLLLHSFSYSDAAERFRQVQQEDPDFVLGYWGEAMTHNHPIWLEQDTEAGRAVLNRLGPSPDARLRKARSDAQRRYLGAVEILFGEGDKLARDAQYSDAMEDIVADYPDDSEAKAFYALSLLERDEGNRTERLTMKAAGLTLEVLDKFPNHPGALHYFIHSVDDPTHAQLGLNLAYRYESLALPSEHAAHMPAHIYGPLGLWQRSVSVNQRSWEIGEKRIAEKKLTLDERSYHSLAWLIHAHLQLGQYEKASQLLRTIRDDVKQTNDPGARRYLVHLKSISYWITEKNLDAPEYDDVKIEDLQTSLYGTELMARIIANLQSGKIDVAKDLTEKLAQRIATSRAAMNRDVLEHQGPHCGLFAHSTDYPFTLKEAEVIKQQSLAAIAQAEHRSRDAVDVLRASVALADELPYTDYGGPMPPKPPHEYLGDALFENGDIDGALREFNASLATHPHRSVTLLRIVRAASKLGERSSCRRAKRELETNWKDADATVKGLLAPLSCD